jgi:hypothetical protein
METQQSPIEHFSYSSLTKLLRNEAGFTKVYIDKIYDTIASPSAVVGQACHKFVESLLTHGLDTHAEALQDGYKHIASISDAAIEYGKTGSREKILKEYAQGCQFYMETSAKMWETRNVLFVEQKFVETIHDTDGKALAIPAKCFTDVVWESLKVETFAGVTYPIGTLFIEDHKFVKSYADEEDIDPARLIQAMFNFHIVREKLQREPAAILYNEIKLSKNKDNTPQAQYYTIDMQSQAQYFATFYRLYDDCTRKVVFGENIYLPNFFDQFDGKQTWLEYHHGILGSEARVAIAPKMQQLRFVEKDYVESAADKVGNEHLIPEEKIRLKFQEFGIPVDMKETYTNGSIAMYTCKPSRGVKMSAIEKHDQDIAIALKARSVRIQAPILGTDVVGIEVPVEDRVYRGYEQDMDRDVCLLEIPLGMDVFKQTVLADLAKMPHLLVAGTTGSGKSTFLKVILEQITHADPELVRLILIDPKRVELSAFKNVPHLLVPPIYSVQKALDALQWLVNEMEARYDMLEQSGCTNIDEWNGTHADQMEYIVTVIDEYANLAMSGDIEASVVRLAQMARAVGIHLIVATQRPSVDVITGLIKSNFPTRVCFAVPTRIESQIILDQPGAQELTGNGDMLYMANDKNGLQRLQGFSWNIK